MYITIRQFLTAFIKANEKVVNFLDNTPDYTMDDDDFEEYIEYITKQAESGNIEEILEKEMYGAIRDILNNYKAEILNRIEKLDIPN